MEISVLQSLIDRTSNQIAEYEGTINFLKSDKNCEDIGITESARMKAMLYNKSRLPKLRKIQKALKKEIAFRIEERAMNLRYEGYTYTNDSTGVSHKIVNGEVVK